MTIPLGEAENSLPHLNAREFHKKPECCDANQLINMSLLNDNWTVVGWAYTGDLDGVRRSWQYSIMFNRGEHTEQEYAWCQTSSTVFRQIATRVQEQPTERK